MADESTRSRVSNIVYVGKDGSEHKTPEHSAKVVRVSFENGFAEDIDVSKLSKEMQSCAMLQGFAIKLQRSFASAKGDVETAIESFLSVKENLENGIWASKREGSGPRLSILAEAVEAALVAAGQTVDDNRRAAIVEKLKDDDTREATMKDLKIKAHYERLRAERAAERAAKIGKEAEASESNVASMF